MTLLNNNLNINLIGLYPEIFLLTSVLIVICVLVTLDHKYDYELNLIKHSCLFFIYSLLLTIYLNYNFNFEINYSVFYNSLIINQLILNFKNFVCLLFVIISLLAFKYFRDENIYTYEFFILLNLVTIGLFSIISANDLLVMYMGIEILSLSFYILTTMKIHSNFSTEAGMKYFILGAFSSGLLLYGSSLIYGSTGTINFSEINLLFQESLNFNKIFEFDPLILGIVFVTVGILFKLGAAPFHM